MPSLTGFHYSFTPKWWTTALTLISMSLFISLGCWQLKRADEKREILAMQSLFLKQAPVAWVPTDPLPAPHQKIQVEGYFMPPVIFLDNQHDAHHQFGFHVLSPLLLNNDHVIMVDRGWIQSREDRAQLPLISTPKKSLQLSGTAYYPSKKQWVLGQPIEIKNQNLAIIELIDIQLFNQFLHKSVYPFIIRLDDKALHGYKREWTVVNMPPARHKAYAFQWFAITLTIFVLFISLNITRR
jgi:surfeit locus 1 family protein